MRDVSQKSSTLRTATATATLAAAPETIAAIRSGNVPKADPVGVARVAGIQAAKRTSELIPYCHQVPLDLVQVDMALEERSIRVTSHVKAIWKTGVEMEALVAASTAALTLYDMLKIIDETMEIRSIKLLEKKGGKSSMKAGGEGVRAAVLVLSDSVSRGTKQDSSGSLIAERLKGFGCEVGKPVVLPDDADRIRQELLRLSDQEGVDLILTTGGTGEGPHDVTPEATLPLLERRMTGVEEALHSYGQDRLPMAMLSRGVAGIRGKTLIINLAGSKGAAEDGMNALFPALFHTFRMMKGEGHS